MGLTWQLTVHRNGSWQNAMQLLMNDRVTDGGDVDKKMKGMT